MNNKSGCGRWISVLVCLIFLVGCSDGAKTQINPSESPSSTQRFLTISPTDTPHPTPGKTPSLATQPTSSSIPLKPRVRIPQQSEWVDYGTIFEAGAKGEWDYYLWGGFAFSVIKKGDTIFLYYQGASDYRTEFDETVLWRAVGVATSTDGIHFKKHQDNPILTWFPNRSGEEGAVSSGVTIGDTGEIFLFYGANTYESKTTVNADTRVAISQDGLLFKDAGLVLDHNNRSLWGNGDELFAVDAIYDSGQWIIYYIPNGTPESGLLGVAYGNRSTQLNQTSAVMSGEKKVPVWGSASHIQLDADTYALILNNSREKYTEVRLVTRQHPAIASSPVVVYRFNEVQQAVLLLDNEKQTWFLYYRTYENSYGVKVAPVGVSPLPDRSMP